MGLPLTVYPGTYTPGAETALHAAVDVINETWAQANTKTADLEAKIAAVTDESTGWLATIAAPHVTAGTVAAPSVVEPTVTIPTEISTANILTDYETQYGTLRTLMIGDLTKLFTDYFPEDMATYDLAQNWVKGAIQNPNGGLPVAVQEQLLADDHARATIEAARATSALTQKFAALRFPLPPGALASGILQIQQNKQNLMAESSRKLTAQSVDMVKFAIDKALAMRQIVMGATLDYLKTLSAAPSISSQVIGIGYDAQTKLISAVSGLMGARTEVQKLIASVGEFNVTTTLDAATKNQSADMTLIEDRLKALLTEIQAFAQMATSLFNNLHASSGTGYNVSVS